MDVDHEEDCFQRAEPETGTHPLNSEASRTLYSSFKSTLIKEQEEWQINFVNEIKDTLIHLEDIK